MFSALKGAPGEARVMKTLRLGKREGEDLFPLPKNKFLLQMDDPS